MSWWRAPVLPAHVRRSRLLNAFNRFGGQGMVQTPDVDLTDGHFYADGGARDAYRWMRKNQPVFRDRNGLAAATTYQAIIDAERNPQLFSNKGGIRPGHPRMPYMIDM